MLAIGVCIASYMQRKVSARKRQMVSIVPQAEDEAIELTPMRRSVWAYAWWCACVCGLTHCGALACVGACVCGLMHCAAHARVGLRIVVRRSVRLCTVMRMREYNCGNAPRL